MWRDDIQASTRGIAGRRLVLHPFDASLTGAGAKLRNSLARFLLSILVIVYWVVGGYPFQWSFPFVAYENVVEKAAGGGLVFPEHGIAYTETAPEWVSAAIQDHAFEVELAVRPYSAHHKRLARIFTVSLDHRNRNFTIGQLPDGDLIVRLRTSVTVPNGTPGYRLPKVFRDSRHYRLVVRVEPERMRIELDGRQLLTAMLPRNALSTWNPRYPLALGNELTFNHPWRGKIDGVTVRVRGEEFSYGPTDLRTPETYVVDAKAYLRKLLEFVSPTAETINPRDATINIVGFVPFGLLLAFVGSKPLSLVVACAWCALMSLSIEIAQIFLDARISSAADLIFNTMGGFVGAWIGNRSRFFPADGHSS